MSRQRFYIGASYAVLTITTVMTSILIVLVIQTKFQIFNWNHADSEPVVKAQPFPVSVDLSTKTITETTINNQFVDKKIIAPPPPRKNWWNRLASFFSKKGWYQNLASPVGRIIVIWSGERKEEVTKNIAEVLGWSESEKEEFIELMDEEYPEMLEGKYFPGKYVTHKHATPADIQELILNSFESEIMDRYTPAVEAKVPLNQALVVASLLEREASDFDNMREVSGVIWNRLFIDMPLQLDASLQYIKGSQSNQTSWWPKILPNDKYVDSPFNTYKYPGLPPAPIANPSAQAILAALNPVITDCLFYFHTDDGNYHCSNNYPEHVGKLRSIYGRGS